MEVVGDGDDVVGEGWRWVEIVKGRWRWVEVGGGSRG